MVCAEAVMSLFVHYRGTFKALGIAGSFGMAFAACDGRSISTADAMEVADAQESDLTERLAPGHTVKRIYWSDGDSGRIDGLRFRLADIDAPETGGVGARGGAKCEAERELGFAAKEWAVEMTRTEGALVAVTDTANVDRYGRQVLSLSVAGEPLDMLGIDAGHYKAWPHRKGRAVSPKPNWCS